MDRVVVVGAGLAGHRAALALRQDGFAGELVVVSDEPHLPYDRPPLSKQLLAGEADPESIRYTAHDALELTWRAPARAVALDPGAHELRLDDGEVLPYDGLVVASGRRARTLPDIPLGPRVHVLRGLDDAVAFREAARGCASALIVGAGFIGCEVAATLRRQGVEQVDVVDVAPQPLTPLGPEVGAHARALHEQEGVRFRLGVEVEAVEPGGRRTEVTLADGDRLQPEVVLLALGSVPNTDWLADAGLELRAGAVLCDEHLAARGAQDVVAAGDVAAVPHPLADGAPVCIEHWAIARDAGAAAARNLVAAEGERRPFATVPTFWSDQYDVKMKSAGLLAAADSWVVVEDEPERRRLVVEAHRDGDLVGAVVWNRTKRALEYQRELAGRLEELVAA